MKSVPHELVPITDWNPATRLYAPVAFGCAGCLQEFPTEDDPGWAASSCLGLAPILDRARELHQAGEHRSWIPDAMSHPNPADCLLAVKQIRGCPTCHLHWLRLCSILSLAMAGRLR